MSNEIAVRNNNTGILSDGISFEHAQRVAKMFASSELVPNQYRNNVANCLVAMEIAHQCGISPMTVFQNLNVIHGKPSWSSTYVIASINASGKFKPIRFRITGEGDDKTCVAWTTDQGGEVLEGPPVSIRMAKAEGWFDKNGSKWKTMPELMMRYRAASFFGRLYAPEIMNGMQTEDEVRDIIAVESTVVDSKPADTKAAVEVLNAKIKAKKSEKPTETKGSEVQEGVAHDDGKENQEHF
jgi:hypothetical protein